MELPASPRISREQVPYYASRYRYPLEPSVEELVGKVRAQGCLTKQDLVIVAEWKTARVRPLIARNSERDVEEITRPALATSSVRLAVDKLQALVGVGMPVASTILHWFHRDPYPILDFRALWSLGIEMPKTYTLSFWEGYVLATRELALAWGFEMRTLDRALWQYSKEHQEPG